MLEFYKNLLRSQQCTRKNINMQVIQLGPTLNYDEQIGLYKQFSNKDIKNAFFSIPSFKSLGPDGYSSGFFNTSYGVIGPMVWFFLPGVMPNYISATKLIVLPKVPNPQAATDFRPISYCNIIYKCITKLLCQMIKAILAHLIDPS